LRATLEDAVRREVAEETGVGLLTVEYAASQAWPFPAGLMAGFRAMAASESATADGQEIVEARWFSQTCMPARNRCEIASFVCSSSYTGTANTAQER
jgi:NAD+ diphosphatase